MKMTLRQTVCATFLAGLALLCPAGALAAGDVALKLTLGDGSTHTYVLSERPTVTFDADNILFTTPQATTSYPRVKVVNITFASTSGQTLTIADNAETLRYTGHTVEAPDRQIDVHAIDGRHVTSGYNSIDLSSLSPGIYIVSAGRQTIKIKL